MAQQEFFFPNIDLKRRERNLSKVSFAKTMNISAKTYLNWQKHGNIPAHKLVDMAKLFKCSVDDLLSPISLKEGRPQNENHSS